MTFEFPLLPSGVLQASLKSSPQHTLSACNVEGKQLIIVNSGEQILVFDIQVTMTKGTSGLIKIIQISEIIKQLIQEGSQEKRKHPNFLE